jgi:hypothetical protein
MNISFDRSQLVLAIVSCAPLGFLTFFLWNTNERACILFLSFVTLLIFNLVYPWKFKQWQVESSASDPKKKHAEFVRIVFQRVHFFSLLAIVIAIVICIIIPTAQRSMPEYIDKLSMDELKKINSDIPLDSSKFIVVTIDDKSKNHGHSFMSNLHSTRNPSYTTEHILRSVTPTLLKPIWDIIQVVLILILAFLMMAFFAELIATFSFGLK